MVSETNPVGLVTTYEYDAAGNRRFKVDGNGQRTEYRYDANRRLRKVLFADGTAYDYDYDARGHRILERSPSHERGLHYDALGRLDRVEDRTLGRTLAYGYDALGMRESMTVDTGETVRYRWDALGRLAETTDPEGATTRFGYDAAGQRVRATYGNGTAASWAYDGVGQVLSIVYADRAGEVQTAFGYQYDASGNRTFKAFADGTKEAYGYDALDRLTTVDYPGGRHVEYQYDAVGNRLQLTDSARSQTRWAASATASSANPSFGPVARITGAPDGGAWMPNRTDAMPQWVEVAYTQATRAKGLRIHEVTRAPSVARVDLIAEDGTSHTVFEGGDQTKDGGWLALSFGTTPYKVKKARVWTVPAAAPAGGYPETIDAVGLEAVGVDEYEYNGFNQLLSVTGNDGKATAFTYDDNGNQVTKTERPAGGAAQLTQYVYDQDNRLRGIALPGGVSNAFEYDANGLRTKKTDSTGTSSYLLDGLSVVAQYAPGGARQAWYTQSLAGIDEVLNVVNTTGKYWYQSDALGSVYALTTSAGAVQARGGYDAFGAPVALGGTAVGQPFGFTGREHEGDSGLVYARARYLNPAVGRWDRADPIGQTAGPNYYAYADGRVAVARDPMGLATDSVTAYAAAWPASFISLMVDLGVLQQAVLALAMVGSAAAVAIPIAEMISTKDETKTTVTTCPPPPPARLYRTYYRGLSMQDLNEFMVLGVVLSKGARGGLDFIAGLLLAASPMTILQHTIKSAGSPFVSVTTSALTANAFAVTGGQASTVVISVETNRTPIPIGGQYSEYLFFWMLGFPGERLRFAWGGN